METFVFALRLQQLRCSALVLRLQTHIPKKRTVAECVLSLRELGPQETEHWLELNPPSKSSVSMNACFYSFYFNIMYRNFYFFIDLLISKDFILSFT